MKEQHQPGVYITTYGDGSPAYRVTMTYKKRHISLGTFRDSAKAGKAYQEGMDLVGDSSKGLFDYDPDMCLPFEKYICLLNYRDTDIYISHPILLKKNHFTYHFTPDFALTFDIDDLFYYSSHKIAKRGNHFFVADYGSQVNVLHRYGIKSNAVEGRDFKFKNGDHTDFRYENILILNTYHGVTPVTSNGKTEYKAIIHVNGNWSIGRYKTAIEAAIAYNKAADILHKNGIKKQYRQNYIDSINASQYADIYVKLKISPKIYKIKPPR